MQKIYQKEELIEKIRTFLSKYPYVLKAELFGSYQSGEANIDSDVDLILVYDKKAMPQGLGFLEIELDLEDELGIKVDTWEENLLYDFVKETVKKELVYEKNMILNCTE